MMVATLQRALREIKGTLAEFEPDRVAAADGAKVFALFLELQRVVGAGKTLHASRAADAGLWRDQGHRSPASWMAETAEALQSLPETTEALRRESCLRPRQASGNVP
jgi:hypothetical protein